MNKSERRVETLLRRIGKDAAAAVELLEISAACLEAREPLPAELADHLAKSFRVAVASDRGERVRLLGDELGLTTIGAAAKPVEPRRVAELLVQYEGLSETALKAKAAKMFDVSPGTALKHVKKAKSAAKLTRQLQENGAALVRRRTIDEG